MASEPITVLVKHEVLEGKVPAFLDWTRGIASAAESQGFLGHSVFPPDASEPHTFHVAFRFESVESLHRFWDSAEFARRRTALADLVKEPASFRFADPMESWLGVERAAGQPRSSTHKMTVIVFLAILPLVAFLPPLFAPVFAALPAWLGLVLTTAILVVIMSYVAVPLVARVLAPWLRSG